jgi:hypothetical protein
MWREILHPRGASAEELGELPKSQRPKNIRTTQAKGTSVARSFPLYHKHFEGIGEWRYEDSRRLESPSHPNHTLEKASTLEKSYSTRKLNWVDPKLLKAKASDSIQVIHPNWMGVRRL